MISVLVLTKNEEQDLPGCLASVRWCDDIHIFDSFSTDGTLEIAYRAGASVVQRKFDDWSSHQNWGLAHINFKHPWVFYIDADERMTPELAQAAQQAVLNPGSNVAFRVQRRDFFLGRCLKHAQATPFYLRLFRPQSMRYERLVNPISIPAGPVGRISGFLDHYPFSKGIRHWLERHNSYSTFEATQIAENRRRHQTFSIARAFTAKDFNERRFHQKELFYRMPGRPLLKWCYMMFVRGAILDGRAGVQYANLQAIYEYFIVLKTRELQAAASRSASGEGTQS